MTARYKRFLKLDKSLINNYVYLFKHILPVNIGLVIISLLLPSILTFLASVFVFGILYLDSYAILMGDTPPTTKEIFTIVRKKFLNATALTISVIGICIFAFVGPAVPFDLLPNSWLSKILSFAVVDIFLLICFSILFITTCVYLSYSLMFFWLQDTGIVNSLEKSYALVKGQWWRAAGYVFIGNIVPMILFLVLPVSLVSLLVPSLAKFLLIILAVGIVYPVQTLLNIAFFQTLQKNKTSSRNAKKSINNVLNVVNT